MIDLNIFIVDSWFLIQFQKECRNAECLTIPVLGSLQSGGVYTKSILSKGVILFLKFFITSYLLKYTYIL